ncbi:hypothetical protein L1286_16990 [Pseudoalteromonas sp. SMS1]|uniref:hypothetical protein n=1 Tax=Pseudoalteromonas sp. SMS1 TaxID=2908894 RepID=UPI001F3C49F6|nr:hypothetical protein [Pseudoalteromonas sp. SMS1]MCF2859182.1 hypothetical protein [Pseudoalteromonas sp. SMS1]
MKFFLTWKSWQVFLLVVLLPFGFQFLLMETLMSSSEIDHEMMFNVIPLMMLVFIALYLLWFWTLGTELNKIIPEKERPSASRFKFGIKFNAIYMVLFQAFFISTANGTSFGFLVPVIFILHICSMYFMFYSIYFISKNLVTFENKVYGTNKSSTGTFFLMWFFPLGIWFVQPRINKMYAAEPST